MSRGFLARLEKRPLRRLALVANRYVCEVRGKEFGLNISLGR
jgi:hypothetical protein